MSHHPCASPRRAGDSPDVDASSPVVVSVATRLLAELHTSFQMIAGPVFGGHLDRALVFALLLNIRLSSTTEPRWISINSCAMALGRPFETVRRHVTALITAGMCERGRKGVRVVPGVLITPPVIDAMEQLHDVVVRYVKDSIRAGTVTPPAIASPRAFTRKAEARSGIDIVLAIADRYRPLIADTTDLTLVLAVLAASAPTLPPPPGVALDAAPLHDRVVDPTDDVATSRTLRIATLARIFSMAESTVRRRAVALARPGGPLIRERRGLRVAPCWLRRLDEAAHADGRHGTLSFGMARVAAAGFPFDDPASAYIRSRPTLAFD